MTGHLVLSTLHTNDASTTPQRIINMGIPSFLVSSTTNLVIAQRLVRKICKDCIYSYTLDKQIVEELDKHFDLKKVQQFLIDKGILSKGNSLDKSLFYRGKGCKKCVNSGYKGRVGIFELMDITPEMAELITNKATVERIYEMALAQGMITLTQDGFIKALKGETSVEEVLRVTQE